MERDFACFWGDLGVMLLFSLLAIALTAFLEWPAYVALGTTNSSVNQFPTTFSLNIAHEASWMGLLDAMRQVAGQHSRRFGAHLQRRATQPVLRHLTAAFGHTALRFKGDQTQGETVLPWYATVLYAELYHPAVGLYLARFPFYQHDSLPLQLPVFLCGPGDGVSKLRSVQAASMADHPLHDRLFGVGRLFGFPAGSGVFGIQPGVLRNLRRPAFCPKSGPNRS